MARPFGYIGMVCMDEIIIDAEDMVAGRLASKAAKLLLNGNTVKVVNAEKAVILGNPVHIVEEYRKKLERGDPYKGPFYPKVPDKILQRIIRGMMPYKKPMGKAAFKRLRVYDGIPEELKNRDIIRIKGIENKHKTKFISLRRLSDKLGGKVK